MHYTLKDHQGNLMATVCGNDVERLSYDAWGRRRNTTDFGYGNVSHTFDRGYTLHEHYDDFNLINMNGSCYDPLTSAFLSVDAYVQDPASAQAFNHYAYCLNKPPEIHRPERIKAMFANEDKRTRHWRSFFCIVFCILSLFGIVIIDAIFGRPQMG